MYTMYTLAKYCYDSLCYCLGTRTTLLCQLFTMKDWECLQMLVFVTGSWYMPKEVVKLVHVQLTMNCFQLFFI